MQSDSSNEARNAIRISQSKLKRCAHCPRTFQKEEHLRRHQRSHTGERPFGCRFCHRQYARSDVLQRHLKSFHAHAVYVDQNETQASKAGRCTVARSRRRFAIADEDEEDTDDGEARSSRGAIEDSPTKQSNGNGTGGSGNSQRPSSLQDDTQPVAARATDQLDMAGDTMNTSAGTTHTLDDHAALLPFSLGPQIDSPQMPHTADMELAPSGRRNPSNHRIEATVALLRLPESDVGGHQPALESHLIDPVLSNQHPAAFTSNNIMTGDAGLNVESVPSTAMLPSQHSSDSFWFGSNLLDYMEFFGNDLVPNLPNTQQPGVHRPNTFPRERYSQVQRLWPTRRSFAQNFSPDPWNQVVLHKTDNVFSDPFLLNTSPHPLAGHDDRQMSTWAMDDQRRRTLVHYLETNGLLSSPESSSGGQQHNSNEQSRCEGARLPPTRLLNLALAMAFRRYETLLPFIHQPTFLVKTTPDSIVFSMCLLGLVVLDSEQTKAFALMHLNGALQRCYQDLSQCFGERKASWKILVALASATLLLTTYCVCGEFASRDETQAEMLYNHTISLAQLSGLFAPDSTQTPSKDVLSAFQAQMHAQGASNEVLWKAWARVESAKRIIASLYTMDAWWAYSIRIPPSIRSRSLCLELPCSTKLFQCRSATAWRRTIRSERDIYTCPVILETQSPMAGVILRMATQDMNPTAMNGILCMIWIHILELQAWQLQHNSRPQQNLLALNQAAGSLTKILTDLHCKHEQLFKLQDANCATLWHFLNINLVAHLPTFELAAGREGAESARGALDEIAEWGRSKLARRACLHAAGIYKSMRRRRTGDGTMFHSESALFTAALVIGLFVFTAQEGPDYADMSPTSDAQIEPYEFLDEVDWSSLDMESDQGFDSVVGTNSRARTPAAWYVSQGGSATFSGISCQGGYDAAKTILLEFASLLEEIGKWNAKRLCQILMTLSDSLLDVED